MSNAFKRSFTPRYSRAAIANIFYFNVVKASDKYASTITCVIVRHRPWVRGIPAGRQTATTFSEKRSCVKCSWCSYEC